MGKLGEFHRKIEQARAGKPRAYDLFSRSALSFHMSHQIYIAV